jgi:hypothetical protein
MKSELIKNMKIKVVIEITAPDIYDTVEFVTGSLERNINHYFYDMTGFEKFEITEIECKEDLT